MEKNIFTHKEKIKKQLKEIALEIKKLNLPWSNSIAKSLLSSSKSGKLIRSSLVLLSLNLFNKRVDKDAILIASSLEYLHTALLVHDDIMDHDEIRRGKPTIHKEYENKAKKLNIKQVDDFGISMAICVGDISIFAAYYFLSKSKNIEIINFISNEFLKVGFGQTQDLYFSHSSKIPKAYDILEMYKYKTARYTFSLPLIIGAKLAKSDKKSIKKLEKIGLLLGLIFQLRDDYLTLEGDSKKIGKKIGNDIAENKKTLYNILLREKSSKIDYKIIDAIFGKKDVNSKEVEIIKNLIKKYKVDQAVKNKIIEYKKEALVEIKKLKISERKKNILYYLLDYLENREK